MTEKSSGPSHPISVRQFAVGNAGTGLLYVLDTRGRMWKRGIAGWSIIDLPQEPDLDPSLLKSTEKGDTAEQPPA